MDITRLTRASHRQPRPGLRLLGRFDMAGARVHEFCGGRAPAIGALGGAGDHGFSILWIRPAWIPDRLHMAGVAPEIDPGRLIFADARRGEDLLWSL